MPIPLRPDDDAVVATCAVLGDLAGTIDRKIPGAIDHRDPEELHDLRVAVRRSRSILRELKGALPEGPRRAHAPLLRALADATSEPRDLDVLLLGWSDVIAPLPDGDRAALEPARAQLVERQAAAHRALGEVLQHADTTTALAAWRRWLDEAGAAGAADRTIGPTVGPRVEQLHRHLVGAGRAITGASPPEELHELRKQGKRLRYLIDGFAGLFPAGPRKAYLAHLKALQEVLGAHQDAEVQAAVLRSVADELAPGAPGTTAAVLALGRLVEVTDRRRAAERAAFAARFAEYDRKRVARLVEEMVAGG